ncbi:MAG: hypothetical protein ACRC57_00790 [Sarcina sp.]
MQVDLNIDKFIWKYSFLEKVYKKLNFISVEFNDKRFESIFICLFQLSIFIITKSYFVYFLAGGILFLLGNTSLIKNIDFIMWNFFHKNKKNENVKFDLSSKRLLELISKGCEFAMDYTDTFIISFMLGHNLSNIYSIYDTIICSIGEIVDSMYQIVFDKINHILEKFNVSKVKRIYSMLIFSVIVYVSLGVILYHYLNRFMKDWEGYRYILGRKIIIFIILNICIVGMLFAVRKSAKILYVKKTNKKNTILMFLFTISSSILLGHEYGIIGIVGAGMIGRGVINLVAESVELFEILLIYDKKDWLLLNDNQSFFLSKKKINERMVHC